MTPRVLLTILLAQGSPGQTAFSVEAAADCAPTAPACPNARWSDFYGTWVRKESAETAAKRYELAATTLVAEARQLLCVDAAGAKLEGCVPYPGVVAGKRRRWDVVTLSSMGAAVAQLESGFREDVMVGRGWAKVPSQDGGRGRGPAGEVCFMQIHPSVAWRFADAPEDVRARAQAGDKGAREEIAKTLLGGDEAALRRCWRTGLRMLIHSRAYCDWWMADMKRRSDIDERFHTWDTRTISLYGTGTSCTEVNSGKTGLRVAMFRKVLGAARQGGGP